VDETTARTMALGEAALLVKERNPQGDSMAICNLTLTIAEKFYRFLTTGGEGVAS
jgi:hypothetical protein